MELFNLFKITEFQIRGYDFICGYVISNVNDNATQQIMKRIVLSVEFLGISFVSQMLSKNQ